MSKVMMPQRKQDNTAANLLPLVGTVAGGIAGSVIPGAGTLAGAAAGNTAGSLIGGLVQKPATDTPPAGGTAMQRRLAAPQPMNPDQYAPQLAAAEQAAMQLPKDQQAMYLPAIQKARSMNSGGGYA